MTKKIPEAREGFFTPRKKKVWIALGLIALFILLYGLGTIITNPVLHWIRIIILTVIGLPVMIFEFIGVKEVPFAMTIIGLIAYLCYSYVLSCVIYAQGRKRKK